MTDHIKKLADARAKIKAQAEEIERLRKQNHESARLADLKVGRLESEVTKFRNERAAATARLGRNYFVHPQSRIVTGGYSHNQREEVAVILADLATLREQVETLRAALAEIAAADIATNREMFGTSREACANLWMKALSSARAALAATEPKG